MENITNWFTYVNDNLEFILEETLAHARIVLTDDAHMPPTALPGCGRRGCPGQAGSWWQRACL